MLDPDDYDSDPYGHVTNQAGHTALVGMPFGMLVILAGLPYWAAPIIVAVGYAALWEWGYQRFRYKPQFDWRDSLMDTACVMAGASIVAGMMHGLLAGAVCWAMWATLVFWGGMRRWKP